MFALTCNMTQGQNPVEILSKAFEPLQSGNQYKMSLTLSVKLLNGEVLDSDNLEFNTYANYTEVVSEKFERYDTENQAVYIDHERKELVYMKHKMQLPENISSGLDIMKTVYEENRQSLILVDQEESWLIIVNKPVMGLSNIRYVVQKDDFIIRSFSARGIFYQGLGEETDLRMDNIQILRLNDSKKDWNKFISVINQAELRNKKYPNYYYKTI